MSNVSEVISDNIEKTEVSVDLLRNLRHIIEVVNSRGFNWKMEEMLPVGLVIKQTDDILSQFTKDTKDTKDTNDTEVGTKGEN